MAGPLDGLRVVELASEWGAYTGKLVADLGAEVILVEPEEGHRTRMFEPFVDDRPDPEMSLWFWHYNTSKMGVTLDVAWQRDRDILRTLLGGADVFLEAEPPGRLARLGLGYEALHRALPDLVMVSVTPFGPGGPRHREQATDLTLLASGGPLWSCGYDDHQLPPVRGGGNQAVHIAGHFAAMSLLVALLARRAGRGGQHVEVDMNAAANVTTEQASYGWLAAGWTVQRQTGRHASPYPTRPTQVRCADGRYLNTGTLPRRGSEFRARLDYLEELDLRDEFPLAPLLEMGEERGAVAPDDVSEDPLVGEIVAAGREAVAFIAARLPAQDVFVGFQRRGIPVGVVNSPEEVMSDPHFVDRGFPVQLAHDTLGRTVTYPGAPYRFGRTPWELRRRAPRLGEHNALLLPPASNDGHGPR